MRTTNNQFDMMVTYMEQHGDLTKLSCSARGKARAFQQWEELTSLLNSDGAGDTKSADKWKKVWSDLKNNIKKKAAKINKIVGSTGGGPALLSKLTDIEQRVLNIIGAQAATGLEVPEAGLLQAENPTIETTISVPTTLPSPVNEINHSEQTLFEICIIEDENELSTQPSIPPPSQPLQSVHTNTNPVHTPLSQVSPRIRGSPRRTITPRRRLSPRPRTSRPHLTPRRRVRSRTSSYVDQTARVFLNSDMEWRNFQIEKFQAEQRQKENDLRMRELELASQTRWQELTGRALDILDKIADKI